MFANHRAKTAVGIFVALLLLAAGRAADKPAKGKGGLDKLEGAWDRDGQVWVISGDEIVEYDSARGMTKKGKVRLDSSKKPKQIDIEFTSIAKGRSMIPMHGIYEVEGETLKLCLSSTYSPRTESSLPRPSEFEAVQGVSQVLTFQRRALVKAECGAIHKTFLENEALADETFTGRMVEVTGKLMRVQREGGGYAVLLSPKTVPLLFGFDRSARSRLAKLKAGESVTIRGVCLGKSKVKGGSEDEAIVFVGGKIIEAREGEPE